MKRSRIICSSIIVLSILLSVFLVVVLGKSSIDNKSNLNFNIKLIHVVVFMGCIGLYVFVKNKLLKKVTSKKLINIYCYMFLAVLVFVSRLVMSYVIKEDINKIVPSYQNGFGSYINYTLAKLLNNTIYSNIVINTIIVYICSILIKKIMLNITNNDFVSTITSVIYIFIPKSLINIKEYIRYEYNILVILFGLYIFLKIIDIVKDFDNKNNKYIYYSIVFGIIQGIDILLGGSYIFWILTIILTSVAATYIDIIHIKFSDKIKNKFAYKKKKLLEKIEKINISKLVYVSLISLSISLIFVIINSLVSGVNNFEIKNIITGIYTNLSYSRNYYIVLIIFAIVFDILGLILKRDIDVKMIVLKVSYVSSIFILPFIIHSVYESYIFDTFLSINVIVSICNVCINREEKVKLLKEKN